ncbi:zinc-binding dehydrogenase (plasmid) [Ralstonia solanacearum]|uniref:Putative zinc-binding dehydrogenase n=1 Tax=Ralstonia solanacearum TaxID=305 RepID=A0A0S4UYI7_RALSL|nr:bi-domain-containing oxidoreductase [Ralstonia pseudosolanacearum]APC66609.1 dehydrogenase [Ralstonia solanacearum OE1-1]NKA11346.1 dehydrogenase [Ralstonia solanacearum]API77528.1 dehydrogenase [Ralstonia pseudosolanacearum]ASL76440.1 dehydrogenase [Ralstonia pseudosolanacearum]MCK4116343.1 zinc-binding dehydrogenase [Ralstonia pseudosolanacearum]
MRQILQDLGSGTTNIMEAPCVAASPGTIVSTTRATLISAGTERMLVDFGRASLLAKARQQPEKVKMVLNKIATDGLSTTLSAVRAKLNQPIPLGYCNVGTVHAVGAGVEGFKVGDRVVSNGSHADVVRVPRNLCARIPDEVDDESAVFTVVAAIGLQGIRLAEPTLGEAFVVTGVGLIGLLAVQLLRAHGCRVLAIDFDSEKLKLAAQFGAETCNPGLREDPVAAGLAFSRGRGVDGVIITASTASSEPVTQAAQMCRKRGRIVLVGVTGLELNRADFYEKELSFQVSCSYGPGRYDPTYEEQGRDYPLGFVRWTEQRNFEAVLDMLADRRLDVRPLITHRIPFDEAPRAYDLLSSDKSALGIVLEYKAPPPSTFARRLALIDAPPVFDAAQPVCAFIGAGNYASRVLMPAFRKAGAQLHSVVTSGGVSGVIHGKPQGFSEASTDVDEVLRDPGVNLIAVATRHSSHASLVIKALRAQKHVFVEKPLALTLEEVTEVRSAYTSAHATGHAAHLMVGFNRRFAPQVAKMKALLSQLNEPKSFIMTMNAGAIPAQHWTQDLASGGGRIIGEACHFIDLMRFLADSEIVSVQARRMGDHEAVAVTEDKASITLGFADGSFGTIHYFANGSSAFPKERVEVFCGGRVLQLDNFRKLRGYGWPGFRAMNLWRQDKGQDACAAAFLRALEGGAATPIPSAEIFEVARISVLAAKQLREQ